MANSSAIPWKRISVEALAIVCSILLAFAIDAWWEDRNEAALEQRLLVALAAEFEKNRDLLQQARTAYERTYMEAVRMLEYIEADTVSMDATELETLFRGLLYTRSFHLETGAHNGMLTSGELSIIQDEALRNRLAAWPSLVAEWSEEQDAVFSLYRDLFSPYLTKLVRLRSINPEFAEFPIGESPPRIARISANLDSLTRITKTLEFENMVHRRTQALWYAMRDGETLLAEIDTLLQLINQNLEK
jgi:hypothetical protein